MRSRDAAYEGLRRRSSRSQLLSERFTSPVRAALCNPEEPPNASLDVGRHPGAHHKSNAMRVAAVIFVMLIVVSCSGTDSAPAPISMFDGSTRQLSDFGTEVVVLNFWATWCAPCVAEMPELETLLAGTQGKRDSHWRCGLHTQAGDFRVSSSSGGEVSNSHR